MLYMHFLTVFLVYIERFAVVNTTLFNVNIYLIVEESELYCSVEDSRQEEKLLGIPTVNTSPFIHWKKTIFRYNMFFPPTYLIFSI